MILPRPRYNTGGDWTTFNGKKICPMQDEPRTLYLHARCSTNQANSPASHNTHPALNLCARHQLIYSSLSLHSPVNLMAITVNKGGKSVPNAGHTHPAVLDQHSLARQSITTGLLWSIRQAIIEQVTVIV